MTAICLKCTLPSTHSAVIGHHYYTRLCDRHFNQLVRDQMPTSGQGSYDRQRDLEDHLGEVIQPMVDGHPNPEWSKFYPEKARQMFGNEAVVDAERKNT